VLNAPTRGYLTRTIGTDRGQSFRGPFCPLDGLLRDGLDTRNAGLLLLNLLFEGIKVVAQVLRRVGEGGG